MQTWQKLLIVAVLATTIVVAGTIIYFNNFAKRRLIISTTTSLYDTLLLDEAEKGYGVNRKIIAYNYFTIVGPNDDPAEITGKTANDAMKAIAAYGESQADQSGVTKIWVSRGDNSGTHSKEQSLWKAAGFNYTLISAEPWYASVGQGMGATLNVANEKTAYTLSDIGTYLKYEKEGVISLDALLTEEKSLLNVYSVMAVNQTVAANQTLHDKINYNDAMDF